MGVVYASMLLYLLLSLITPNLSQSVCDPGPSPENGVWQCLTNDNNAICHLSCYPGYVPANRSRTYCVDDEWDLQPQSLACYQAAAVILGGFGSTTCQLYSQETESVSLPDLPGDTDFTSADFVDGDLITCGDTICVIFNRELWEWQEFPSLQLNHYGGTSSVSYSALYLIGGETSSYEFYDSYEGSDWLLGGKISDDDITRACSAPYSSSHLISGGLRNPLAAVLYQLIDGEQRVLPEMLYPMAGHGCVPCKDPVTGHFGVLLAGGEPYYTATQFWDINLGEWREMGNLQVGRVDVSRMVVMDQKIYIFGGHDVDGGPLESVEVFDFQTNTWTFANAMDQPRAGQGVGTVPDFWMIT